MPRKQPRAVRAALTEDEDEDESVDIVDDSSSTQELDGLVDEFLEEEGEEDGEERKKELEVWEAFKEEHHEVLEQLPLSLHRQFKLMRELDSQSQAFHVGLLASVRRYILLRESLAAVDKSPQPNATDVDNAEVHWAGDTPNAMQVDSTESTRVSATLSENDAKAATPAFQPKSGETTRTLLQYIAQASEEAIRTAEEKVNIAQTAYETVDRHIRLLDQAIKEQETAISLGVRPRTHLAPILPDLVVPRWARPPRVEHSPVPSLSPEPGLYVEELPILELHQPRAPSPKAPKKGKKPTAPKPDKEEIPPPTKAVIVATELATAGPRTRRASVRLTLPAHPPPAVAEPVVLADPNEKRYCYCNQVSFGTMIACDNGNCKMEWFHLECTGLLEVPSKKTKWYCRECKPRMTQKGRSKA